MKKVLLVHDLFSSSMDVFALELINLLRNEEVIVPELPIHPQEAFEIIQNTCKKEHPDVIVGWQSGAGLAQQFPGYDRILVNPDYQVSNMLDTLLNGEDEVQIPYLFERFDGHQNFRINATLLEEYRQMESHQFDRVRSSSKLVFGFFWFGKNEENRDIHAEHYSDVTYLPGENYLDPKSIRIICETIKAL